MLKLPQNYLMDSECYDMLLEHIRTDIIYYYRDNKLFEQGVDIRLGSNFLKIIYNHHHYFVTIVKINNIFHYYLQFKENKHIVLNVTSSSVFDNIIKIIKNI